VLRRGATYYMDKPLWGCILPKPGTSVPTVALFPDMECKRSVRSGSWGSGGMNDGQLAVVYLSNDDADKDAYARRRKSVSKALNIFAVFLMGVIGITGVVEAQSANPSAEKFVLTGVVYVDGGRGLAWLQEPTFTNNQIITLRVGDRVGPYQLTKILEDQVELEGPRGKVAVPLAGAGGASTVAAISSVPANTESPSHELPPHPALNNPEAIVVPRGDPRRNFPAADLLIGAGAQEGGPGVRQAPGQFVAAPPPAVIDRGIVPAAKQTPPPELPPPSAAQNPNAIVVPRGDPSRNFPAATLLIGAGAQIGGGH